MHTVLLKDYEDSAQHLCYTSHQIQCILQLLLFQ